MKTSPIRWAFAATLALATPASAIITIDGSRDAAYGSAAAVQTINTGFGNANDPAGLGGGGEVNAAYTRIENGRLNVLITGNIENNFNKLSVFIDSKPGGENTLSAAPTYDFESLSHNLGGLTFDAGFTADYHLYARWGSLTGSVFTVDLIDRGGGTHSAVTGNGAPSNNGAGTAIQSGVITPSDLGLGPGPGNAGEVRNLPGFLTQPVAFGFNNTNTAGVTSGSGPANTNAALAVTTGFEFSIDLADLGNPAPGDSIKLHVAYGNSNHNFHANQTLGGLPPNTANLGGDGSGNFTGSLSGIDFNNFADDQFFTVTLPGPPALAGDYDQNAAVSQSDLDLVLLNWGSTTLPAGWLAADQFDNIAISQNELDGVLLNWGAAAAPSLTAVPEPASLALLAMGLVTLTPRRRTPARCPSPNVLKAEG